MTSEDQGTELAQDRAFGPNAARALDSLTHKVGNLERERHTEISAVLFLRVMERLDGTFIWRDGPKRGNKYADVFQALSAEMPEFGEKSLVEKGQHVQEFGPQLRAGFYAARKWLGTWYEDTVYCVPQNTESGILSVITLDRDLRLGDGSDSAPTAAGMQQMRDEKLASGQLSASTKRMNAAIRDKTAVRSRIGLIVERALAELETAKGTKLIDQKE